MLWANKKLVQSVTFIEGDTADIALLEAIEQELSVAKYQTFSNLCKQALWQFLFVDQLAPTPESAQPSSQLEGKLAQLQQQIGELEKNVLTQEQNQFYRVEARLNRMAQQLAQLQATLNQQPPQIPQPTPETPVTPTPSPQPQEPEPQSTDDPLLNRLGTLLDDF